MKTKKLNVKKIALIGMLGALGGILMMFKTPLPFMPPFMDFDLAALPEIIGGFALGPLAAVMIVAVKLLVKLAILGTSTAFVGELSNFIVSCAYVLPSIWIYDHHKEKKSNQCQTYHPFSQNIDFCPSQLRRKIELKDFHQPLLN